MKTIPFLLAALLVVPAFAAAAEVKTLAGTGKKGFSPDKVPALEAELSEPFGITRGPDGLLYFCEFSGHVVRRIAKDGKLEIVAGIPGQAGYSGDGGPATAGKLNKPHEIRFDKAGDLYISDMSTHTIRKVAMKSGILSTFAGTGKKGYSGDGGPATQAEFSDPISLQFDGAGNLYICDIGNHRLRRVDAKTGVVTTVCGSGKKEKTPDGAAISPDTPLFGPRTIDFDAAGHGFLALREGNAVYELDFKTGRLKHLAGTGKQGNAGNGGPAREAHLAGPKGIALSPDGRKIYLADTESHTIRVIDRSSGKIDLLIGTGKKADGPDGPAKECSLARPHGIFIDRDGTVFVGDSENNRLRVLGN